jgi:hypothetical protein
MKKIKLKNTEHGTSLYAYFEEDDPKTSYAVCSSSSNAPNAIKNMNRIATLWNNWDEVIEALELAKEAIESLPHSLAYDLTHLPKIEAILSKVKSDE